MLDIPSTSFVCISIAPSGLCATIFPSVLCTTIPPLCSVPLLFLATLAQLLVDATGTSCTIVAAQSFYPGSATYALLALLYNNAAVSTPEWIYAATTAGDIVAALCYVASQGLTFRIRNGGHSFTGESGCGTPSGCVQIDLSGMTSVTYNAATGLATVGPGALSSDIMPPLTHTGAPSSRDRASLSALLALR
jgi:hypothetical protein